MDGLSDAKINAAHSVDVRLRINGQDEWWCGESYIKGLIREVAALRKKVEELEAQVAEQLEQRPERAWLIESRFTPAPTWWTGTDHPAPWTRDSLKAVRFSRKCDAEAAMAALQDGHFCFASEHQWGFGGESEATTTGAARLECEIAALRKRVEELEAAGRQYVLATDPLVFCGEDLTCGTCRGCLQARSAHEPK